MAAEALNAVIVARTDLAPGLMILRIAPRGWDLPEFVPGQYSTLGLPGSAPRCAGSDAEDPPPAADKLIKRAYSIASSSRHREYAEFFVTLVRSGALTPRLFALEPGAPVFLGQRIVGMFTIDQAPEDRHLVLIATGTGLAPYISMLRSRFQRGGARHFAVLLGARHSWDLGYDGELTDLARSCPNVAYVPTISRPADERRPWTGPVGYVQDLWRSRVIERGWGFAPTPENAHVFLCGNPDMIASMGQELAAEGFRERSRKDPEGHVHVEKYW